MYIYLFLYNDVQVWQKLSNSFLFLPKVKLLFLKLSWYFILCMNIFNYLKITLHVLNNVYDVYCKVSYSLWFTKALMKMISYYCYKLLYVLHEVFFLNLYSTSRGMHRKGRKQKIQITLNWKGPNFILRICIYRGSCHICTRLYNYFAYPCLCNQRNMSYCFL